MIYVQIAKKLQKKRQLINNKKEVNMNKIKIKSRLVLFMLLICVTSSFLTACGSEEGGKYTSKELMKIVTAGITNLPEMITVDSSSDNAKDVFTYLSDIDYDLVKDFTFTYSKDGLADEISIIQLKNADDVKEVEEDLNNRITTRKNTFASYDEKEVSKFSTACVVTKDCYVIIIISSQANNGKYAFNEAFK